MATIGVFMAAKLLKNSARTRASSSFRPQPLIPRMIDAQVISERMKKLFPERPENLMLEEKKPLSIGEEKVNQDMEKLWKSYMNERFDDHKADQEMTQKWTNYFVKPFTIRLSDGRGISGANFYLLESEKDADRTDKRKLWKTFAYEIDEEGNIMKEFDGDLMSMVIYDYVS